MIYTTNAIESVNAQLRKVIKTRGHFPSDEAATKLIWLAPWKSLTASHTKVRTPGPVARSVIRIPRVPQQRLQARGPVDHWFAEMFSAVRTSVRLA